MKSNAFASIKKRKLQNATVESTEPDRSAQKLQNATVESVEPDRSACLLCQLQYSRHWDDTDDNTSPYWPPEDSEYETEVEKNKKEGGEKGDRRDEGEDGEEKEDKEDSKEENDGKEGEKDDGREEEEDDERKREEDDGKEKKKEEKTQDIRKGIERRKQTTPQLQSINSVLKDSRQNSDPRHPYGMGSKSTQKRRRRQERKD